MPKYDNNSDIFNGPELVDALSLLETDGLILREWNAVPDKLYNGLVVYADGTNWNPGSGRGVYAYENGAWALLG